MEALIDKQYVEERRDKLIRSLRIFSGTLEDRIEHYVRYLQGYTDVRKKATEPHGLDVWAHECLRLEKKVYNDEERKVLRELFAQTELAVLQDVKGLLETALKERNLGVVKGLLARPLKDEIKTHVFDIIAQDRIPGFEGDLCTLYWKGTQAVSSSALECMKVLKNSQFYFCLRGLVPTRATLEKEKIASALDEIRAATPLISALESLNLSNIKEVSTPRLKTEDLVYGLIAQPYDVQKTVCDYLRKNAPKQFSVLGNLIADQYKTLGATKAGEYANDLKKAFLDTLSIGEWRLEAQFVKAIGRNLLLMRDYDRLGALLAVVHEKYRRNYFESVLDSPKHVKDEEGKKRLLWVFSRIFAHYKADYPAYEKYIKWHSGNEDSIVRIEALLLVARLQSHADPDVLKRLKEASLDDRYKDYFAHINSVLSVDSLLLTEGEIMTSSDESIKSKVTAVIDSKNIELLKNNAAVLTDYFVDHTLATEKAAFIFSLLDSIIVATEQYGSAAAIDIKEEIFRRFTGILSTGKSKYIFVNKALITSCMPYIQYLIDTYPYSVDGLSPDMFTGLFKVMLERKDSSMEAIALANTLIKKSDRHIEELFSLLTNRIVDDGISLENLPQELLADLRLRQSFVQYLSALKERLLTIQAELKRESKRAREVIIAEIVPNLEKALQRAGSQQLFQENYINIIDALTRYANSADKEEVEQSETDAMNSADVNERSLSELLQKTASLPQRQRTRALFSYIASAKDRIVLQLEDMQDVPLPSQDWCRFHLLEYALTDEQFRVRLLADKYTFLSGMLLWKEINRMLYRRYNEYSQALQELEAVRLGQLKEIGRLIGDQLEKIEVNLFGYYELRESLSKIGLKRIFDRPGQLIAANEFDGSMHQALPSDGKSDVLQVITLGLKVNNGEVLKRAYLEQKTK